MMYMTSGCVCVCVCMCVCMCACVRACVRVFDVYIQYEYSMRDVQVV